MRIEVCPVNCDWESQLHNRGEANWSDCAITAKSSRCSECDQRLLTKNKTQCPRKWYVCKSCLPNYCPREAPENPNPIIGKVVWVVQ